MTLNSISALTFSALIFAAGLAAASPAKTENAACRRTAGAVEAAICGTPALIALDREIAERYAALLTRLDAPGGSALRQDQRAFIAARDTAGTSLKGAALVTELTNRLSGRADYLESLRTDSPLGVVGRWRKLDGEIVIDQWATGVLTYTASIVDLVGYRWSCESDGNGEWTGKDKAEFISSDAVAERSLTVRITGSTLVVEEKSADSAGARPDCGSGGTLSGVYFPAERLPDPSR